MQIKGNIIILGASSNPNRISYMAAKLLKNRGYNLKKIGYKKGNTANSESTNDSNNTAYNVDAITVFMNPENQKQYYNYILNKNPKTIIFNPGTENPELEALATRQNIKIISCCTIAMLAVNML